MAIDLREGDYFATCQTGWVSRTILAVEKVKSLDGEARYSHCGIICDSKGKTFESRRRIEHAHINCYIGLPVIIARHKDMNAAAYQVGYDAIKHWDGAIYPVWRLGAYLLGVARFLHAYNLPVCSELVGEHAYAAGLSKWHGWGWNPDSLVDMWIDHKCYDVIYEGKWEGI